MADLPRMNERQFRRAKRLIRRLCANYDGGCCLPLEDGDVCPCPQFLTPVLICKYFRAAVLPADRELFADIMQEKPGKKCCICGVPIIPLSNATKYCPFCAVRERRRKDRERKRSRSRTSANKEPKSLALQRLQNINLKPDKDLSTEKQNKL